MQPTLIYGYPAGTSAGLVAALEWLGQPYRLVRVDMLGEMRAPAYARLNPRHETPVLVTADGRVVTETMAIAAHLAARDAARRISFDPARPEADRMHQLMGFLNSSFTAAFGPLWAALESSSPDAGYLAALRAFGRDQVLKRHDQLEAMLGTTAFAIADHPTLADALLAGVGRWLEVHAVAEVARWPRLAALRARIEATPAVRFAFAREAGETPPSAHLVAQDALADVIARFAS